MKNNLDFIQEKIRNSGVNAPEEMDEAFVMQTIDGITPQPAAVPPSNSRKKIAAFAVPAVAAVLMLAVALGIFLQMNRIKPDIVNQEETKQGTLALSGGLSLKQFQSRGELDAEMKRIRDLNDRSQSYLVYDEEARADAPDSAKNGSAGGSTGAASDASGGGGSAESFSETYKQVEGVDEADIIKTDGKYIYCVDSGWINRIVIFSAEGADSRKVAEITLGEKEAEDSRAGYYSYDYIEEIYIRDNRLIILHHEMSETVSTYTELTKASVYDVSDMKNITLLDEFSQSGSFNSSRMIGDTLYLVSSYDSYDDVYPCCGRGASPDEMPVECIYALENAYEESFLIVSAYDTADFSAQTDSKAILGGAVDVYCNENHMYLYTSDWDYVRYREEALTDDAASSVITSQILKVDLTGGITFVAYTEVEGSINSQYALDEYDGCLRVSTTSTDDSWRNVNNLFVLDESLNQIGSVTGFAKNESIKAVRYVGDTAYVITYEQTDPLFVIDLSRPEDPTILGEVKITGFSTMLVPIDENTVLGLGYHTENEDYTTMEVQEGFKIALFDVSDKSNPKVLDSKSYVNCESAVQYNPKALVYNPDRDDFIIPLNYANRGYYDDKKDTYVYVDEYYGGVLNFKVENGKIVETDRIRTDYDEVDRCVYVGNNIYMTHYDDADIRIDSTPYK